MDVSLRAFFDHPTIKELSDYLEGQTEHRYERIPVCAEQDVYETSSAQKNVHGPAVGKGNGLQYADTICD